MANKRRSNNPLPNWREKIAPDDQERWLPEDSPVRKRTETVENSSIQKRIENVENASPENMGMAPEPSRSYEIGDELNRGVNAEWWRMAQCRAKAKAKWGTGRVNARAVEAETLRLYRQSGW